MVKVKTCVPSLKVNEMALAFTHHGVLWIVLDEENIERIQQNDPWEFNQRQVQTVMALHVPLKIRIAYARKDEYAKLMAIQEYDAEEVIKYLMRGYKITASDHDRDDGYKPL